MKRKEGNNILSREKNVQFKSLKRSRDSSLGICQHCGYNEKNVMRRGPDGRNNLCNACGLFWKTKVSHFANNYGFNEMLGSTSGRLRDPSKGRRKNRSIDQSDLDPLIDVNITALEGELLVIQNELGISEDPSKAIATEGSNNHALYPNDEELPESLEHLRNTLGIDHSSENDDVQEKGWLLLPKFSEQDVKDPSSADNPESPGKTATEPHNEPALDPSKPQSPMKSFTFSETLVTIESLLAFLDKEVPSTSEVDHTPVVGISR
ncbi:protein NOI4 [Trifolium repens]|nr:protein NOI4 [Trifolium repens]